MENVAKASQRNNSDVLLNNGRSVDPKFLDCIYCAVDESLPTLPYNTKFTLKNICGKEFWKMLERGEKIRAGWCMVHLVEMNELPLMFAESRHEYPKYYQLK